MTVVGSSFHSLLPSTLRCRRAFTLLELLVAISMIVALIIVVGSALTGRGSDASALVSAQNSLHSLVGATRAQAALHATTARLLIYAAPPPGGDAGKYLRYFQVVRDVATTGTTQTWSAAGLPVQLPAGVFVVPSSGFTTTGGVTWNTTPATGPISLFVNRAAVRLVVDGQPFGGATGGLAFYIEFTADGRATPSFVGATTAPKLVVSTAESSVNAAPRFNNANAVRGVLLRLSGAITRANDANSF
ncbi:MAG: hypothetical protein RIQ93_1766 [Verrucomicrobiota bacterium]|jgi:type II secretory pathway pseudopilin PulG